MGSNKKVLVAFDFDHTIIDGNSDIEITHLCPEKKVPQKIKDAYSSKGWTPYMGAIFKLLHENGVAPDDMKACIENIPLTDGMKELLEFLHKDLFEVIIISDSNSEFIDNSLEKYNLKNLVKNVYTNPAKYNATGLLKIEFYHTQDWCDLSTENLCKGHILEEHIKQAETGFHHVLYIGDGTNDFCPSLRLKENDYTFARTNYSLWKKLKVLGCMEGEAVDVDFKSKVVEWSSGKDVLEVCQRIYRECQM